MTDDLDVRTAIQDGDVAALRNCLALDRSQANALIHWGNNDCVRTHPLHFVSDMLFNGVLQKGKELPLVEALLEAGACVASPPTIPVKRLRCPKSLGEDIQFTCHIVSSYGAVPHYLNATTPMTIASANAAQRKLVMMRTLSLCSRPYTNHTDAETV
jgi:hypothetical protein